MNRIVILAAGAAWVGAAWAVEPQTVRLADLPGGTLIDINQPVTKGPIWSEPGAWIVETELMPTAVTVDAAEVTTNENWQVISSGVSRVTYGMAARCKLAMLDRYAESVPAITNYESMTAGGSFEGEVFSAVSGGVYRIAARATDGRVKYADVAVSTTSSEVRREAHYVADGSAARAAVNAAALQALAGASVVSTNRYGGIEYVLYGTFAPRMTRVGAGNVSAFAVSEHVLASAKHYGSWIRWTGRQRFDDGAGAATNVNKTAWVDLDTWAATNGWTDAEIKAMNLGDIAMIVCDGSAAVPDGCRPYFMGAEKRAEIFGESMVGVQGWCAVQSHDQAIPLTFRGNSWWTVGRGGAASAREDVAARLAEMGEQYPVHEGDSGKPIFVMVGGRPVVVSHFTGVGGGSDWCAALPVIKAFVRQHGDTIKEIE